MIRKIYSHIYYLFYRLGEIGNSVFSYSLVANVCILVLELWLSISILNYLDILFNIKLFKSKYTIYILIALFITILLADIYYASYKTSNQIMLREVRENPRKKRDLGIAVFIVLSIIANLIFSFYLIKMKYKGY